MAVFVRDGRAKMERLGDGGIGLYIYVYVYAHFRQDEKGVTCVPNRARSCHDAPPSYSYIAILLTGDSPRSHR